MFLYIIMIYTHYESGESMGAEPTLPYLSPQLTGRRLLVGANFASAGIGVLNDTGIQFVSLVLIDTHIGTHVCG